MTRKLSVPSDSSHIELEEPVTIDLADVQENLELDTNPVKSWKLTPVGWDWL